MRFQHKLAAQKLAEVEGKRAEEQAHSADQLRKRAMYLRFAFLAAILLAAAAGFFGLRSQNTSRVAASRIDVRRVTLAPPLARAVCAVHPSLYTLFNALPLLRTHRLAWIAKARA